VGCDVTAAGRAPIRIGNASGFYGDRFAAVREMLTGGPLDVTPAVTPLRRLL